MTELAPYAVTEANSRGRKFAEAKPNTRSEFQRDRDRIIHSGAFRRLEYKTQVFVNHEGDLFRTRLTHSIEVAQIARSIARCLHLNEDLAEAISLAHDLGHTPFGHAGQEALNACMKDYGGFEHNLQSLRVVDLLEERYAAFDGLNLCFETREGILKHCSAGNAAQLGELGERFLKNRRPSLEAQIANLPMKSPTTITTWTTAAFGLISSISSLPCRWWLRNCRKCAVHIPIYPSGASCMKP